MLRPQFVMRSIETVLFFGLASVIIANAPACAAPSKSVPNANAPLHFGFGLHGPTACSTTWQGDWSISGPAGQAPHKFMTHPHNIAVELDRRLNELAPKATRDVWESSRMRTDPELADTEISFDYLKDGRIANIRVSKKSHSAAADAAALVLIKQIACPIQIRPNRSVQTRSVQTRSVESNDKPDLK